jgi:hypothetical protein
VKRPLMFVLEKRLKFSLGKKLTDSVHQESSENILRPLYIHRWLSSKRV